MDNALCGGAGSTLTGNALAAVKAAIFMGDPHNRNGLPYNVGTCKAQGVSFTVVRIQSCSSLTSFSVCRPPQRLHMLASQHQHHSELLRLSGPVLLQWKRCQPSPAVCQHIRKPGSQLHQEQGYCLDAFCTRKGGIQNRSSHTKGYQDTLRCKYNLNQYVYANIVSMPALRFSISLPTKTLNFYIFTFVFLGGWGDA